MAGVDEKLTFVILAGMVKRKSKRRNLSAETSLWRKLFSNLNLGNRWLRRSMPLELLQPLIRAPVAVTTRNLSEPQVSYLQNGAKNDYL